MNKFKIGDGVVVNLTPDSVRSKQAYLGKVFTIADIEQNPNYIYRFKEDRTYLWSDEELELSIIHESPLYKALA